MANLGIKLDMESKPNSMSMLSNNAYHEEIINYMKKANCNIAICVQNKYV